jgi:folylpolyglutamate synthase/dihydropteroate synthase
LAVPTLTYLLDGAHTPRSIQASGAWFTTASQVDATSGCDVKRVLMFACTGGRDARILLPVLLVGYSEWLWDLIPALVSDRLSTPF